MRVAVEEGGLTFCFRAPAVFNDNEDVIALEHDSNRVGRKFGPSGAERMRHVDCESRECVTSMHEGVGRPFLGTAELEIEGILGRTR